MSDEVLLTLRQLADELDLPESTVRYYRDAFLDHIPSVGTGRRRRYPKEAVQVLRTIASQYASGRSRAEISTAIQGANHPAAGAVTVSASKSTPVRQLEEVSNLDLLAAILDGEREQRDALWQMAKEIVRLTEILEGQDKVLSEIADRAGVTTATPRFAAPHAPLASVLSPGPGAETAPEAQAAPPPPPPAPAPPPPPAPAPPGPPPPPPYELEPAAAFTPPPLDVPPPRIADVVVETVGMGAPAKTPEREAPPPAPAAVEVPHGDDIARLKAELEAERQLVERLREAKLQLERRTAEAEEAALERRARRGSVIRRILGGQSGE